MSVRLEPAAASHVRECLNSLCDEDRAELAAAGVVDAQAMLEGQAVTAVLDGERCVALFGVNVHQGAGIPWMLTSTAMAQAERASVARSAMCVVAGMRRDFGHLVNWVHAENRRAVRFIEWLGFTVEPEPVGPGGAFRLFHWRKDSCATR